MPVLLPWPEPTSQIAWNYTTGVPLSCVPIPSIFQQKKRIEEEEEEVICQCPFSPTIYIYIPTAQRLVIWCTPAAWAFPWRCHTTGRCRPCCTRPSGTAPATGRLYTSAAQDSVSRLAPTSGSTSHSCQRSSWWLPTTWGRPGSCACSPRRGCCSSSSCQGSTSPARSCSDIQRLTWDWDRDRLPYNRKWDGFSVWSAYATAKKEYPLRCHDCTLLSWFSRMIST